MLSLRSSTFLVFLLWLGLVSASAQVAAPVFAPAAGAYFTKKAVTVTCATPGATIYYTIDGTAPSLTSPVVATGGTVTVDRNLQLKAQGYLSGTWSALTSASYTVTGQIAAGAAHALNLSYDNTPAWAFGDNASGQLGQGTSGAGLLASTPVKVKTDAINFLGSLLAVDAGISHSIFLKSDGTVVAVGANADGQLGNNTTTTATYPVVVSGAAAITNLAAGGYHNLLKDSAGNVWAFGRNSSGQVGIGSTVTPQKLPLKVKTNSTTFLSNVIQIAAGATHSLALTDNAGVRTLYAWGLGSSGQLLGNGTTTNGSYAVASPVTNVAAIGCGELFSLVAKVDGSVWGWGANGSGQLGNGATATTAATAVQMLVKSSGLALANIIAVDGGTAHSLALRNDGTVWAVGDNTYGQLGNGASGSGVKETKAVQVMLNPTTPLDGIVSISAGASYSMALSNTGIVYVWGRNDKGQLGNATSGSALVTNPTAFNTLPRLTYSPITVQLTAPTATQVFGEVANVTLTAGVTLAAGAPAVTKVEFYTGATLIGTATVAPYSMIWSGKVAGNYAISAVATDANGARWESQDVAFVVAPTVTLSAPSAATVAENNAVGSTITVTRSSITASALAVTYTLSGTASNGSDYLSLSGSVSIPANAATATILIKPILDANFEADEVATVTLASGGINYSVSGPARSVTIQDRFPVTSGLRISLHGDVSSLTADGSGNISQWSDLSGLNNHATQATATNKPLLVSNALNGRPIVRFNGSTSFLALPNALSGATAGEIFVVVKAAADLPPSGRGFMRFGTHSSGSHYPWATGNIYDDFGTATQNLIGDSGQPLDQWHIYNASSQSGLWTARINGLEQFRNTTNTVAFTTTPWLGTCLNGYYFAGDIAAVVVYDRVLSAAERKSVEISLGSKFAFQTVPLAPSSFTARTLAPTQVSLAWVHNSANSSIQFAIERKTGTGAYSEIARVTNTSSYIDGSAASGLTYTYQVRAVNYVGQSPYTTAIQVTTPTTGTAMPLANIRLWLKADGGLNSPVSAWQDVSGLGNHAAQPNLSSQPSMVANLLNGRPVVHFNGSTSFVVLANAMAGATSGDLFVVLKATTDSPASGKGFMRFGTHGSGSHYPWASKAIYDDFGTSVQNVVGDPGQPLDQWHVYNTSSASGLWTARINGLEQFRNTANTVSFTSTPWIGKSLNEYLFDGDIAEVIAYDRVLVTAERKSVEAYLATKFAIGSIPTAPTALQASALSGSQVSINWTYSSPNASIQYSLERKIGAGVFSQVALINDSNSYIDGTTSPGITYTYRIQAINALGASPYSNESSTTTPLWSLPLPLNGIRVWFKADAAASNPLSAWQDQSGLGNHATQSVGAAQPLLVDNVINGRPAIRFNGSSQFLNLPNAMAGATAGEMFVVLKAASDAPSSGTGFIRFGTHPSGGHYPYVNQSIYDDFGTATQNNLGNPSQSLDQWHLYNSSSEAGMWSARINGIEQFRNFTNTVSFTTTPVIGQSLNTYFYSGDIAEVMTYDRVLSIEERKVVEAYLGGKYLLAPLDGDGDGLTNAEEISLGTDPLSWDTNGDGLSDSADIAYGYSPTNIDADGDGVANVQEVLNGTDPLDFYNGSAPVIEIMSGNKQTGAAGSVLGSTLTVRVKNTLGVVYANSPVTFSVVRGSGQVSATVAPSVFAGSIKAITDTNGLASVWFKTPAQLVVSSLISVNAWGKNTYTPIYFFEAAVSTDDSDADGMLDGWELTNSLDPTRNDSQEDRDLDGLANLQEYLLGLRADLADSNGDGISDWEMVANQAAYLNDPSWNPAGYGLTFLEEAQLKAHTRGLWRFNEGVGTSAADSSGAGNTGTLFATPVWGAGFNGGSALTFDGLASYVSVPQPAGATLDFAATSFSVTLRFKTSATTTRVLLSKGGASAQNGYRITINAGRVGLMVGSAGVLSQSLQFQTITGFNDGGWHHLTASIDQSAKQGRIYIDGNSVDLEKVTGTFGTITGAVLSFTGNTTLSASTTLPLLFGKGAEAGSFFAGSLDQIQIFNQPLSATESRAIAGPVTNLNPTVALANPLAGDVFSPGGTMTLKAAVYDLDSTVVRVEYFDGSTKIGEGTTGPSFSASWALPAAGSHQIKLRAWDNRGGSSWSTPVTLNVLADVAANGMPDAWEMLYFGNLNQTSAGDFDADGVTNYQEFLRGSDPTKSVTVDTGTLRLQVFSPVR